MSECRGLSQAKPMSLLQLKAEEIERVKKWVEGPSPLKRAQGFMKSAFQQIVEGRPDPAAKLVISAAVLAGFGYKEDPQLASRIIETARRVVHHALTAKTGAAAGLGFWFLPTKSRNEAVAAAQRLAVNVAPSTMTGEKKLRPIQALPYEHEGQPGLVFPDPASIAAAKGILGRRGIVAAGPGIFVSPEGEAAMEYVFSEKWPEFLKSTVRAYAETVKREEPAAAVAGLTDLFSPYQLDSKGTMWALLGSISPEARAFIARKIPILVHEGMPQRQAVATAYAMARRRFPSVPAAPMGFLSMLGASPEDMVEKIRRYAGFVSADLKEPGHREAAKEWLEHISKLARRARMDLAGAVALGIDISPMEVAGLGADIPGIDPLSWKVSRKRPRWPHPSYRWERAPEEPFELHEGSPQVGIALQALTEARMAQAHALKLMSELRADEAMDTLRRAFRQVMVTALASEDPVIKDMANEIGRRIGKDLLTFSRVTLAGLGSIPSEAKLEPISLAIQSLSLAKKAVAEKRGRDALDHIADAWLMASEAIEQGKSVETAKEILRASGRLAAFLKFGIAPMATPPPPEHVTLLEKSKALLRNAERNLDIMPDDEAIDLITKLDVLSSRDEVRAKLTMHTEYILQRALDLIKEASRKAEEAQDWEARREVPDVFYGITNALRRTRRLKSSLTRTFFRVEEY